MIAEIGHALLWLATACTVLATIARHSRFSDLRPPALLAAAWLWLWILAALAWVFAVADLSVAAVAANTDAALPVSLRLAAIVLREDGGWLAAAAAGAFAASVLAFAGVQARWIGIAAIASLALNAGLLVIADPFVRLVPAPTQGAGFDPAWRDRLATLRPPGTPVVDAPLRLGATVDGRDALRVGLVALTPVAGPDSTAVLAQVEVTDAAGGVATLLPAWRETTLPLHGAPVADSALTWRGWWSAALSPTGDGRWHVEVTRLPLALAVSPVVLAVALAGLAALAGRRARRPGAS